MTSDLALTHFKRAREHYVARRFKLAQEEIKKYKQSIDYRNFDQSDRRTVDAPQISVVIVSHQAGSHLLHCLHSVLAQEGPRFEVILVDNGGNESVQIEVAQLPLLSIKPPMNLLPSEGRNIGAYFASSDIIVFLDDDAIMTPGYLDTVEQKAIKDTFLSLRGRILPKSPTAVPQPKHYNLGENVKPSEFNLEGNMVIRRRLFQILGGFDPLMFGHEGKALTHKLQRDFPGKDIYYCPELTILHNWAEDIKLSNKRERQKVGIDYINYFKELQLKTGISIILRADIKMAAMESFLKELAIHNTYKPIEVIILTKDCQRATDLTRQFMTKFFTCVLLSSNQTLSRFAQKCRYRNCLIVDLPTRIKADILEDWIQRNQADLETTLFCTKAELQMLNDIQVTSALKKIANKLGKTLACKADKQLTITPIERINHKYKINSIVNKEELFYALNDEKFLMHLLSEKEMLMKSEMNNFNYS